MSTEIEVYEEPAEPEHVEAITGGMLDMLNGVESYNTRYTQAVLECAGYVTRREVAGNEGFFSAVGDGIKKVWDYIVNMFKSIYDYFFKTENKSSDSSAKESVEKAEKAVKVVENPKVTPAKAKATAAVIKAEAAKLPEGSAERATVEKAVKDIDTITEDVKKATEIEDLLPSIFKATIKAKKSLETAHSQMIASMDKLEQRIKHYESGGYTDKEDYAIALRTFLNGLLGLPEALKKVEDIKSAKDFLYKAGRSLQATGNNLETFNSSQSYYKDKIKEIEGLIKAAGNKQNSELKKKLDGLKKALVTVSTIIAVATNIRKAVQTAADTIEKTCIVYQL